MVFCRSTLVYLVYLQLFFDKTQHIINKPEIPANYHNFPSRFVSTLRLTSDQSCRRSFNLTRKRY